MTTSSFDSYEVAPTLFQTGNVHLSHDNVQYMTQAERNFNPTTFRNGPGLPWQPSSGTVYAYGSVQTPVPPLETQQEPTSPSSGYFPVLTPSETHSTAFSDRATGVSGWDVEESSLGENGPLEGLGRPRGFAGALLTPSTSRASNGIGRLVSPIHDWPAAQDGLEDGLLRLRETDNQGQLDFYTTGPQYAEVIEAENPACFGQEHGRMPTLSTYISNQSNAEAAPWNGHSSQHDKGQILPDGISDKDLSLLFEACSTPLSGLYPIQVTGNPTIQTASPSPAEGYPRSHRKPPKCNRGKNARDIAKNNHNKDWRPPTAARHAAVRPTASTISSKIAVNRGGRPTGSHLPAEDKISASEVRWQGACFRCWYMREKCTPGHPPCANCKRVIENKTVRSWMTPCSFKRLQERCQYLLPAQLVSQISVSEMRSFLKQHGSPSPRKFLLSLSIGFGEPWKFWAVEIVPGIHKGYQMFGFHHLSAVAQPGSTPFTLTNPPVIPLWIDPLMMQVSIDCWLDKMIADPTVGWQSHWFPEPSQIWQLRVLEGICEHFRQNRGLRDTAGTLGFDTLRWALKLSVLSFVMSHAFIVPKGEIDSLFRHLQNPDFKGQAPQGYVYPGPANKFVKMMILPVLRLVTERTLSGLNELLRANEPHAKLWDQTFGVVFLCLMAVSSTQRSLFQRAIVCEKNNDPSFSFQNASDEARSIDSELVDYIIGMFHDKLHTNNKTKPFNPLGERCGAEQPAFSPFAKYVKAMTDMYYPDQEPTSDDPSNVGAMRLLAKWIRPFLSHKRAG